MILSQKSILEGGGLNVKSQYVENLPVMLLDRFETENKSRHCTQRGKLLQP